MCDTSSPRMEQYYESEVMQENMLEYSHAIAAHEDQQLRGAWRAGYDYLYKISLRSNPLKRSYVPSNREKWPHSSEFEVERWDIAAVDDETIMGAVENAR